MVAWVGMTRAQWKGEGACWVAEVLVLVLGGEKWPLMTRKPHWRAGGMERAWGRSMGE